MKYALLGKKVGSTRLIEETGDVVHVTVVEVAPSVVVETKTQAQHGYDAVVLASGKRKAIKMNNAQKGYAKKHALGPYGNLFELRLRNGDERTDFSAGNSLDLSHINLEQTVDITAVSKGKGFAGTIKRWNFAGQDRSHGNSLAHRVPGSIGINGAGRVWRGKKMSGRMGGKKVTLKRVALAKVDAENNLLFIKGHVPGANGGEVLIRQ